MVQKIPPGRQTQIDDAERQLRQLDAGELQIRPDPEVYRRRLVEKIAELRARPRRGQSGKLRRVK